MPPILLPQVSLVGQEPVLFARTVEDNITYGLTDIPMEAVMQAATKANAHDFISSLPKGYETSNYSRSSIINQPSVDSQLLARHGLICVFPAPTVDDCMHDPPQCFTITAEPVYSLQGCNLVCMVRIDFSSQE